MHFRVPGLRDVSSLVTGASNDRFELAKPFFSRTHLIDWTLLYHCSFLDLWSSLTLSWERGTSNRSKLYHIVDRLPVSIRGIDVVRLMIRLSIVMCFRAYEFPKQNKFQ